MKKRKCDNPIERLPLDCWCHVINFFDQKEDFISLCLSVKGLWEKVKLYPHCTSNIQFIMKNHFPLHSQTQVSYLLIYSEDQNNLLFQKLKDENLDRFFQEVFKFFPNLSKLILQFFREFHKEEWAMPSLILSSSTNKSQFAHLKRLDLTISDADLSINALFPRLYALRIYERRKYDRERFSLSVEWKNMPKVSHVELLGWNLKSPLTNLKKKVKFLLLGDTSIQEDSISGFEFLDTLKLETRTISQIRSLSELPMLRRLFLDAVGGVLCQFQHNRELEIPLNFHLKELPMLEEVEVNHGDYESYHVEGVFTVSGRYFEVMNLPNLRKFKCMFFNIGVKFSNTPKLENIKLDVSLFDISSQNDLLNLKCFHLEGGEDASFGSSKFIDSIHKRKSLEDLTIGDLANNIVSKRWDFQSDVAWRVDCSDVINFTSVHDCPKLTHLKICVLENTSLKNLPELRELSISVTQEGWNQDSHRVATNILEQIAGLESEKFFRLEFVGFDFDGVEVDGRGGFTHLGCSYSGPLSLSPNESSKLRFLTCRYSRGDLKVVGLSGLEEVDFIAESDYLCESIVLSDCKELKEVLLYNNENPNKIVRLEALPTLAKLSICSNIFFSESFEMDKVPTVTDLSLFLRCFEGGEDGFRGRNFLCSGAIFPKLRTLSVKCCYYTDRVDPQPTSVVKNNHIMLIGLTTLQEINIGTFRKGDFFAKKITDIDLENVQVTYEGAKRTLREFIDFYMSGGVL